MIVIYGIFFLAAFYLLLRPVIHGAVYFPTHPRNYEKIIELADMESGKMADLGSGDGRIVMAFAERGIEAHGFEINPLLVLLSKRAIKKKGLEKKAFVHWKSFWKENLSPFDLIYVYGFPHIMESLGEKLKRELKPGAKIISNSYRFKVLKQDNEYSPYLYLR